MHGDFCLVFTASPKWRVELRAKIGRYRNWCFKYPNTDFTFILLLQYYTDVQQTKNKTHHPMSSNSHPKIKQYTSSNEGGYKNQREHRIILTKYEAVHQTEV